jgi:lipid A 4'-phosphatase
LIEVSHFPVLRRRCAVIAVLVGFCWVMRHYPALDLRFSARFYDAATHQFLLQSSDLTRVFLDILQAVGLYFPVACALLILLVSINKRSASYCPHRKVLCYVLLASVLVPGVGVNLLKLHFGRPRPVHVEQFGGVLVFSPALVVSGACSRNCSFVSGDAAVGFVPLALALLATHRRRLWINAAFVFGVTVALLKVMQGRHFLSDVVVAAVLTAAMNYELYQVIFNNLHGPQRSMS